MASPMPPGRRPATAATAPPSVPITRLLPLLRPFGPHLAVVTILLLLSTSTDLVFPLFLRQLIDSAFMPGQWADDQGHLAPRPLDRLALQLAALFLAGAVMSFGTRYLTAMVGERMVA
ncbi:MAG TPA: ABC transporter transmembrane domain-containing protein, partial [Chloroflexota bacterium]|nr:ABC transporter transmembrane domain-containing protein [Chloroflexota bacterium]